jgi:hypothetical protein
MLAKSAPLCPEKCTLAAEYTRILMDLKDGRIAKY